MVNQLSLILHSISFSLTSSSISMASEWCLQLNHKPSEEEFTLSHFTIATRNYHQARRRNLLIHAGGKWVSLLRLQELSEWPSCLCSKASQSRMGKQNHTTALSSKSDVAVYGKGTNSGITSVHLSQHPRDQPSSVFCLSSLSRN